MSDFTPKLPEVKFNKNGYEIRTEILDMAKGLVSEEYEGHVCPDIGNCENLVSCSGS